MKNRLKENRNQKRVTRILAAGLAVTVALPVVAPTHMAWAEDTNTDGKEEVVYIMTDGNGDVKNIDVVNIFRSGTLKDYGDYSAIKVLTTNDTLEQNGNEITGTVTADKLYYQGTMDADTPIPWKISIRYFLDGKEYDPDELAGADGSLEIRISIQKNTACKGSFYDDYALQMSVTMDGEHSSHIVAEDATIANVGADKQLTYTILPGKGLETSIQADVTDFEMAAVAINGIRLNLNVEIDEDELMDKVNDLIDATKQLKDGSEELQTGASSLETGAKSLEDGVNTLNDGTGNLNQGILKLEDGITQMQSGLDALNARSDTLRSGSGEVLAALETIQSELNAVKVTTADLKKLVNASGDIKQGIQDLEDGVAELKANVNYAQYQALMKANGLDIATLRAGNDQTIATLSSQIQSLQTTLSQIQGVPGYEQQAAELQTQITQLQQIVTLLTGNNAAIDGTKTYLDAMEENIGKLQTGVADLKTNYQKFHQSIVALNNQLSGLVVKMSELTTGINTLTTRYQALDQGINDYTDGVKQLASGYTVLKMGISELAQGSQQLLNGTGNLSSGTSELYSGVVSLCDGTDALADGNGALYDNTKDMDDQIQEQIDSILDSLGGNEGEPESFVSDKNTDVKSVQFVIKTDAIEKPDTDDVQDTEPETLTFWQKLINLFKRK